MRFDADFRNLVIIMVLEVAITNYLPKSWILQNYKVDQRSRNDFKNSIFNMNS